MNIVQKIKLSVHYGRGIYLVSAIYSLAAAGLCCFYPMLTPTCILLKLIAILVIWYLFNSLQGKHTIYFYLNLGISRIEYYAIPFAVEFICFMVLLTFTISLDNAIR